MRFKKYLDENGHNGHIKNNGHISHGDAKEFEKRWLSKLKPFGLTAFELSTHFGVERLNHKRNNPPLTIKELDFVLDGFIKKMGSQFKKDIDSSIVLKSFKFFSKVLVVAVYINTKNFLSFCKIVIIP